jgi:pimeloyl-[acyl-carrier protein] methyl ester esterase
MAPQVWAPLQAYLPGARALPLPGYAGTAAPAGPRLQDLADALAPAIPDQAVVVGWSLGGLVALSLALQAPQRMRHLVLIGATPCFVSRPDWPYGVDAAIFEGFAEGLRRDYAGTLRRFLALQLLGAPGMQATLARLRAQLLQTPRPAEDVLMNGLNLLRESDFRHAVPGLRVPLTVIHGAGDTLAPIAAARWLAQAVPGARLHEVARSGHAPFLTHPEFVAARLAVL